MINAEHYSITKESLPVHELNGLNVRVTQSADSAKIGMQGLIVNETARTFVVETLHGEKVLPKTESTFTFDLNGEMVEIRGKDILSSPIERLKNGGKVLYG